jgi:hypothetical protein
LQSSVVGRGDTQPQKACVVPFKAPRCSAALRLPLVCCRNPSPDQSSRLLPVACTYRAPHRTVAARQSRAAADKSRDCPARFAVLTWPGLPLELEPSSATRVLQRVPRHRHLDYQTTCTLPTTLRRPSCTTSSIAILRPRPPARRTSCPTERDPSSTCRSARSSTATPHLLLAALAALRSPSPTSHHPRSLARSRRACALLGLRLLGK